MQVITQTVPRTSDPSTRAVRGGWTIIGLVALFLAFDSVIHLLNPAMVVDASARLGYRPELAPIIGVIEIVCLALYLVPRTSVLGAVLLTGYLGGAVATHVRAGSSLFGEILFPVYVGALVWGGLLLVNAQLRSLISNRRP